MEAACILPERVKNIFPCKNKCPKEGPVPTAPVPDPADGSGIGVFGTSGKAVHRLVSGAPNPTALLGERLIFVKQIAITFIYLCKFQRIARISYKGGLY